jgi:hypothetical protein
LSPHRLIFIDETGAATNMARRYGRRRRGGRLDVPLPHGHWKTTTLVVGLTSEGFVAPCVTDGAMNGRLVRAWMEQALVPILQPGDVVIMDDLGCHKSAAIRLAIEARQATLLYLPPYSPDLDPSSASRRMIRSPKGTPPAGGGGEQAFAKLEALLRQAAGRSVEALWSRIGELLDRFAPAACANYLANAGYGRSG